MSISECDEVRTIKAHLVGHIVGLDGLRGIAVLWVIWHNCFGDFPLSGLLSKAIALFTNTGWVGVQLFFTLSGFLITGILLDLRGKSGGLANKLRVFYWRRSLRIFPLYYAVLAICFFVLPYFGVDSEQFEQTRRQQFWYWLYLVNWAGTYTNVGGWLPHFWSLAIEEQFYLLWPFVVLLLSRSALRNISFFLVISALSFRFGLMVFYPDLYGDGAYHFTIARWDSLAIGALLAILLRDEQGVLSLLRHFRLYINAIMVFILFIIISTENFQSTPFGIGVLNQTLASLFFAGVIFQCIRQDETGWLKRALSLAFFNNIGRYSYALYVLHLPVRHFWELGLVAKTDQLEGWELLLAGSYNFLGVLIITYVLARVSWLFLENPVLKFKDRVKI